MNRKDRWLSQQPGSTSDDQGCGSDWPNSAQFAYPVAGTRPSHACRARRGSRPGELASTVSTASPESSMRSRARKNAIGFPRRRLWRCAGPGRWWWPIGRSDRPARRARARRRRRQSERPGDPAHGIPRAAKLACSGFGPGKPRYTTAANTLREQPELVVDDVHWFDGADVLQRGRAASRRRRWRWRCHRQPDMAASSITANGPADAADVKEHQPTRIGLRAGRSISFMVSPTRRNAYRARVARFLALRSPFKRLDQGVTATMSRTTRSGMADRGFEPGHTRSPVRLTPAHKDTHAM